MTDTIEQASTQRLPVFGLIGILGEKALALGRADEAERLLGPQIELLVDEAAEGRRVDAVDRRSGLFVRACGSRRSPRRKVDRCRLSPAPHPPPNLLDRHRR